MSKKLEDKQRRRLAEEQRRAAQKRAARKGNLITIGIAIVVLGLVVTLVAFQRQEESGPIGVAAEQAGCTDIEEHEDEGNNHLEIGTPFDDYRTNPPTSGNHWEQPAAFGFYADPQPKQQLVHNLEHGQIVFWYRPDAPQETIDQIEEIVEEERVASVATPYDTIEDPYTFAMTAWGASQSCERVSEEVVNEFRERYQGKGPERIPGIPTFSG